MKEKKQYNFLMKVPNNNMGLLVINTMKQYLNKDSYRLKLRGTNPDWEKALNDGIPASRNYFQTHTPLKYAREIRVYLHAKVPTWTTDTQCLGIDDVKRRQ